MSKVDRIVPATANDEDVLMDEMTNSLYGYRSALLAGESLEDAAYLLPLGIETSFLLAGNLRVWFEYFQKRLCKKHVQDEHYRLALDMWNEISELFPIMRKAHPCKACRMCKEG